MHFCEASDTKGLQGISLSLPLFRCSVILVEGEWTSLLLLYEKTTTSKQLYNNTCESEPDNKLINSISMSNDGPIIL